MAAATEVLQTRLCGTLGVKPESVHAFLSSLSRGLLFDYAS